MKKRFRTLTGVLLSVLLMVTMIPILPVSAASSSFRDVDASDWYSDSVQYVNEKEWMFGTSEDTFEPQTTITRAMIVTILHRMEGEPPAAPSGFKDVPTDTWFTNSVAWAAADGIVNGYSDQIFAPSDDVTREQIAAIIFRYAEKKGYEVSEHSDLSKYSDRDEISDWAEEALAWANGENLITGFDETTLAPGASASRAQVAVILKRFHENMMKQNTEDPDNDPDNNSDRSFTDRLIDQMPKDKNWTISPYSLEMCLAMVANGAKGKTQEELLKALQIHDLEKYNAEVKQLLETYDSYNSVMSLETANSIWMNQDQFNGKGSFLKSFSDILNLNYLAEAKEVRNSNSIEEINSWAADKTHGKITHVLDEDHRQFAAALANAVYFKAAWLNKFYSAATEPRTFYNLNGTEKKTPFMTQTNDFPYYEADGIQAVELPYQNYSADEAGGLKMRIFKDADFSMYFILSEKEINVQEVLDHAEFQSKRVHVTIPKFKLEYGDSLVNELKTLGISTVFNPYQADLSGMIDISDFPEIYNLYLDEIVQKAFISIDEEGTEAAAVTVAIIDKATAILNPLIYDFTADHPFYFVIRDNTTGRILFVGKYNNVSD